MLRIRPILERYLPPALRLLRGQLLLLILVILCPLFILVLVSNLQQRRIERAGAAERLKVSAQLAAAREANLFDRSRELLASVASYPFLVMSDNQTFSTVQCQYLRVLSPMHENFGIIESDGTLFCNAERTNAVMNLSSRSFFQRVLKEKSFALGDYQPDPFFDTPSLSWGYPVFDAYKHLHRVFFGTYKLQALCETLSSIPLPPDGVCWIIDNAGVVVARQPEPLPYLAQNLSREAFVQRALAVRFGSFESRGLDGIARLYAVTRISSDSASNLLAVVGVPQSSLYAAADYALTRNLLLMAGIAALALATTWFIGQELILQPVNRMVATALRLARGDLAARTGVNNANNELSQLALTLDEMADKLAARQLELEQANADIKQINNSLEERVKNRTSQLEASNRELESFSYSISHDLRAPLRHITGFAGLMREDAVIAKDEKNERFLKKIEEAAHRMGQLVDDLLSFSRMAKADMRVMPVEMNQLIREVRDELLPPSRVREVQWEIGPLPVMQADPILLRQVVINLVSNALKYSAHRHPAEITIGATETEADQTVFIRDNGAGFDMKYAHKLFGVFQRLHGPDEFEGTGIGLANVQRIILRHGGKVWGEAAVNKGATFYFTLPKKPMVLESPPSAD